jgi:hypothetical protein
LDHGVYGVGELKMKTSRLIAVLGWIIFSSCSMADQAEGIEIFSLNFQFTRGSAGWSADFTDYPVNEDPLADSIYQWKAEVIPGAEATSGQHAYMISCNNVSGDVFMFLKKKIEGLRPNTNYNVVYEIQLSSNAVAGQGIILKGGASELEPKKVIENGYYVLNIDKGTDTTSGENAISFGDIGASNPVTDYNSTTKGNSNSYAPFITRTNSKGELWLVLGTDSLFEGTTTVYFTRIDLVFSVSE